MYNSRTLVVHTFYPRIQEAEADKSLNSQTARTFTATQQNPVLKNQRGKRSITVPELGLTFLSFL